MFIVLFFLIAGIIIGVLLHKKSRISMTSEKLSTITIYLLLFTLGLKAGSDNKIMSSLDTLGLTALGISLFALTGSVLAVWGIYKYVFKEIK